jgi:HAD domain in Swiss Army Knife RNA repair proteins
MIRTVVFCRARATGASVRTVQSEQLNVSRVLLGLGHTIRQQMVVSSGPQCKTMTAVATTPLVIVFLDIDGVLLPIVSAIGPDDYDTIDDAALDALLRLLPPRGRLFPQGTVDALSRIWQRVPIAQLVLSSTWRVHATWRRDILTELQTYGDGPLTQLSQFYDVTDPTMHSERQHEIYRWLQQNHGYGGNNSTDSTTAAATTSSASSSQQHQQQGDHHRSVVAAWIALDDEDLLHGPANAEHRALFEGHVIHCQSKIGLTIDQAEEAAGLLQAQLLLSSSSPPKSSSATSCCRPRGAKEGKK